MWYFLYKDNQKLWRWMLFGADDAPIAKSVMGYSDQQYCLRDIDLVKGSRNVPVQEYPPNPSVSFEHVKAQRTH